MNEPQAKYLEWYRSYQTGISSETIFEVMTGIPVRRHDMPYDPSDFSRCYELLERFPEWKPRLHEVSARFPRWKGLIDNWDKLTELYEEEKPTGEAPKLYKLIDELRRIREGG